MTGFRCGIYTYIPLCVYIYIHTLCVYIYTHTHNGILLSHKKNKISLFAAIWMNLENIMLSETSQTEKDKYLYDVIYIWNLKNNTNEYIWKTEADSQIQKTN